ncbi:MAG: diguanylate cyclase [Candidatus Thiodiazotropha sp.]
MRKATRIAIAYAAVAGLWITFSDTLLDAQFSDASAITHLQMIKGWGFVLVTSLALLWIMLGYLRTNHRQVEHSLEQRAELRLLSQFRESIIDNASVWINVIDTAARVTVWNKAAEQISGYTREEVLDNPHIWEWLYPDPDYRNEITAAVADILDHGREVDGFETRIRTRTGELKVIAWHARRFFDDADRIAGSIAIGRDITAYKRAQEELVERERQLATLMDNLPGMAYRCLNNETRTMQFVSNGCRQLIGYEPDDLQDNRELAYVSIVHEADRPAMTAAIRQALADNRPFTVEYRIRHKDGRQVWVWEQGQHVHVNGRQCLEGIIIDISQRKRMEQELQRLATRDPLTELYNRRELEQQFHEELMRAERYDRPLTLLWIDVDHFKSVNDRFGHQVGDKVLRELAQLLQSGIRSMDYAARYGGEELAIILPEMDEPKAREMAERLREVVENYRMVIDGSHEVRVTISVGVATFPVHGKTMEALFKAADRAMYKAKQEGRNRVCTAESDPS